MQRVGCAQALYRCNLFPVMHQSQTKTRVHAPAIHMHRTCAALPVITALLCPGKSNGFTDAIEQRRTRVDAKLAVLAVDAQGDRDRALDVRSVRDLRGRGALTGRVV